MLVFDIEGNDTVFPSNDISKISGVTLAGGIRWCTVFSSCRVKVGTSRGATVGVVAKLKNEVLRVEAENRIHRREWFNTW
jgi:hypothetical protein